MNHEAIYNTHPTVKRIADIEGGVVAYDADGNQITLDQSLVDAAAAELATENAWNKLRTKRNQLLSETDYLALSDTTLSAEMAEYRQQLRNLPDPSVTSDPANPTWPVKPS